MTERQATQEADRHRIASARLNIFYHNFEVNNFHLKPGTEM